MRQIHVLLVDDEQRFVATTKKLMEKEGLQVLAADGGPEAMRTLRDNRLDVVVLDIRMPGPDGLEVLRWIKKDWPLTEVILLTGHGSVETAIEGLKLGASDYLLKPCDVAVLCAKVREAFAKRELKEEEARRRKVDRLTADPRNVLEEEDER